MNYFEPEIGKNDMTSNKHMNGYFLEQEALRGVGIPKFLMCPGFALFFNTVLSQSSNTHILLKSWSFQI